MQDSTSVISASDGMSILTIVAILLLASIALLFNRKLPRAIGIVIAITITGIHLLTSAGMVEPFKLPSLFLPVLVTILALGLVVGIMLQFVIGIPWRLLSVTERIFDEMTMVSDISDRELFKIVTRKLGIRKLNRGVFRRALRLLRDVEAIQIEED